MNVLTIIPTYNEREDIRRLIGRVFSLESAHSISVLVVDDSSPDGTGEIVHEMMNLPWTNGRIHILQRERKAGLAAAYIAGFTWGLERRFDVFIEMDADLSHDPGYLPALIDASERYDFVIASRYVSGGGIEGWSVLRKLLSRGGSLYSAIALGLGIRDLTGGFNAWNRRVLEAVDLQGIRSAGYCFQIELKYRAAMLGCSWTEIPILFRDRVHGYSKMSPGIAFEAMRNVLALPGKVKHG